MRTILNIRFEAFLICVLCTNMTSHISNAYLFSGNNNLRARLHLKTKTLATAAVRHGRPSATTNNKKQKKINKQKKVKKKDEKEKKQKKHKKT